MNAVDLLIKQHRALEAKFDQLMDVLDGKSKAKRTPLVATIGDELTVHIASEEQVFYPAVKAKKTEDILMESLEEHLSLKRLLSDLLALNPDEDTFKPKLKVLQEQCEHHHEEEEENLFPKVRKLLDEEALNALGKEMDAFQKGLHAEGKPREAVHDETDQAAPLE